MSLSAVARGKQEQPMRIILYGLPGIGKSTFAAGAPAPIFIGTEDGTAHLDVPRFPAPETWQDVMDAIAELTTEKHEHKTLVLDTLDRAEALLWDHICKRDNQKSIEAYGFAKGYVAALDEWRMFLKALERLRQAKPMNIILIGHAAIRPFNNDPNGGGYDRYEMSLHHKAAGMLKGWVDTVLFANYEAFISKDPKTKRTRGVDTGARLIHTQWRAIWDAKNRYDLPETLPLSWPDFEAAIAAKSPDEPGDLLEAIKTKAKQLGGKVEKHALGSLKDIGNDAARLAKVNDWLNSQIKIAEEKAQ